MQGVFAVCPLLGCVFCQCICKRMHTHVNTPLCSVPLWPIALEGGAGEGECGCYRVVLCCCQFPSHPTSNYGPFLDIASRLKKGRFVLSRS